MKKDNSIPSIRVVIASVITTLGVAAITTYGTTVIGKLNAAQASIAETQASVAEVHTLANSNLSEANQRLDTALEKIEQLNVIVLDLSKRIPEDK